MKKSKSLIVKLILLLICLILIFFVIQKVFSKYKSEATINPNIETALYIFKEDYQELELTLSDIYPREEPFTYFFTISNTDGVNIAETYMDYDLKIKTTTNLPLDYEIYLNEEHSSANAQSIITSKNIEPDEYGTYFQTITTDTQTFGYEKAQTNTYELVIYFPEQYKDVSYNNIKEAITITVNAKQKM